MVCCRAVNVTGLLEVCTDLLYRVSHPRLDFLTLRMKTLGPLKKRPCLLVDTASHLERLGSSPASMSESEISRRLPCSDVGTRLFGLEGFFRAADR